LHTKNENYAHKANSFQIFTRSWKY
jgi:hypothetical protein